MFAQYVAKVLPIKSCVLLQILLTFIKDFLELSTTPEVNITKRSTIELGYEIYQLRSAQCRNQGKILLLFSCACTGNFSYKVYHSMPLKKNKLPVPYLFVYIGLTFHQLYIELFWQNSSIKFNEMNLTK